MTPALTSTSNRLPYAHSSQSPANSSLADRLSAAFGSVVGRLSVSRGAQPGLLSQQEREQSMRFELGALQSQETELSGKICTLNTDISTLKNEISNLEYMLHNIPSSSDADVTQAREIRSAQREEKQAELQIKANQLLNLQKELSGLQKEIRNSEQKLLSLDTQQGLAPTARPALVGPEFILTSEQKAAKRAEIKQALFESIPLEREISGKERTVYSLQKLVGSTTVPDTSDVEAGEQSPHNERMLQLRNNLEQKRTELGELRTRLAGLTETVKTRQLELWKSSFAEKPGAWHAIHKAYGLTFNPVTAALSLLSLTAAGVVAGVKLDFPLKVDPNVTWFHPSDPQKTWSDHDEKAPSNGCISGLIGFAGGVVLPLLSFSVLEATGAGGVMRAYSDLEEAATREAQNPELEMTGVHADEGPR